VEPTTRFAPKVPAKVVAMPPPAAAAQSQAQVQAKAKAEARAKAISEALARAQAKAEAKAQAQAQAQAIARARLQAQAEVQARVAANSQVWQMRMQLANAALTAATDPPAQASGCQAGWQQHAGGGKGSVDNGQVSAQGNGSGGGRRGKGPSNGGKGTSTKTEPSGSDEAPNDMMASNTLRTHLQMLHTKDPDAVFIVRKITRLGFDSPEKLRHHFEQYGVVEWVLVSHSHVRCQNRSLATRLRPSSLGFIVMASCEVAQMILAQGPVQMVDNVAVRLSNFTRRMAAADLPEIAEE